MDQTEQIRVLREALEKLKYIACEAMTHPDYWSQEERAAVKMADAALASTAPVAEKKEGK